MRLGFISAVLVILQWFSVSMYIYCIKVYWTSGHGPRIPTETMVVMVALNTSGAVSFTFAVYYFYSRENNFETKNGKGFRILPKISFRPTGSTEMGLGLSEADWLLTNVLFALGIIATAGTFISAFAFNSFLDFHGIHNFTARISGTPLILYYIAVGTVYWSFCGTICACCIFHVISRDLINHISFTEQLIIEKARNRKDFYTNHECMLQYTKKMTSSMKYWFAVHNVFFVFLAMATIFEWFSAIKRAESKKSELSHIWFSQLTGSSLIAYKFAFPFFSASRVTARYIKFYYNIARSSMLADLPDLTVLRDESGFKMCGIRITTNLALLAILSSFIGALKFIADFYSTG